MYSSFGGFSSYLRMGQGLGFFFFILSCVCLGGPCFCSAHTDSIKPGEGLQFSKLLVSAKGTFTLGFFSLDTRSYLGIWYTSDVNNKKVWVANRDNPISGTNANLMLDGNGTLMIIHSGGDPIVLNSNQASRNSIATLLDSGNFVVSALNSDGSVKQTLWESFDDPTDTLLPGMKLGINLKTGQNWSLASWINEQVADPGTFTLEWNGTQLVMKRRGDIYWSSGILKDRSFEFIQTHHNIYYFISVCNDNEIYFSYSVQDGAISKWVLNWRGGFFDTYGTLFVKEDMCDRYDKYPGCAVQEPPTCRTRDFQFMKQSVLNSGYPSLMNIDTSLGLSDCQAICRNNCSCTACNTVFTNGTGCQFWRDKLPRARVGDANQEELYVLSSSKDIGKPWWIWIIILVVVVFLFMLAVFCCSQRNSRGDGEGKKVKLPEVGATDSTGDREEKKLKLLEPPASGITGDRGGKKVKPLKVGASGTTGDREEKKVKLPEVGATGSTGDREEKKVKLLEPPASGITGDRGGKKVKPLKVGASGTTGDREGKKVKLPEVGATVSTGDREEKKVKLPEVGATASTGDREEKKVKLLEPPASGITGDRGGKKVKPLKVGASGTTGDREGKKVKLPEVGATASTGDREEKKVKLLEPPASGITGDRGGKKVKPLKVGASGTTGDREGKKVKLPEVGATGSTGDREEKKVKLLEPSASGTTGNREMEELEPIVPSDSKDIDNVKQYTFVSVKDATNNFSDDNKLGKGGFGPVYKGILPGGQEIAVKRLSRDSTQGLEQFNNEKLIAKQQHRNLVRLLGCCIEGKEKMLIYEFMPNGSLEDVLFAPAGRKMLDWNTRCKIIEGIVQGLDYLHRHSRLNMVHRDLKASNILLDLDMNPKISDFGTARTFERNASEAQTSKLVGTFGYMPPEYVREGAYSQKTDVYGLGVLLLEIVSGQRNISNDRAVHLVNYAQQLWGEGKGLELVDPAVRDPHSTTQMLRCIHVALLCVQNSAEERPTMSQVCSILTNKTEGLPNPNPPPLCT